MSSTADPNNAANIGEEDLTDLSACIVKLEEHLVGGGRFGDVYKGMRTDKPGLSEEDRMVAIKAIRPIAVRKDVKSKILKRLKREITVWQGLAHKNIVPFLGLSYSFGSMPALISVWMVNGQLDVYLFEHPEADRGGLAKGLASGLLYLHTREPKIIHGDIKAANTLIDKTGNARLCDFGLSRMMSEDDLWMTTTVNSRGSLRWMAPELLEGSQIWPTPESDVYAFAMTILEMLTGRIPFHHHRSEHVVTVAILSRKEIPNRPTEIDGAESWRVDFDELWEYLTRCWDPEPGRRPSAAIFGGLFRTGRESRMRSAVNSSTFVIPSESFRGHRDTVTSVAFSPDSTRIASGSYDRTVRLWERVKGSVVLRPFEGHTGSVNSVAYSPDGKRIASGSWDKTVRVWDTETGEVVFRPLQGHTNSVHSVAYSPNGKGIVSGSWDKTVRVWDAETGEVVLGPFNGHKGFVTSVVFSPDGRWIASGSDDYTVRVWNAETGKMASEPFEGHAGSVTSVAFSPDGQSIASGSHDKTVRVWNAKTGEEALFAPFEGHVNQVASVAFSPDGKWIVSGSGDKTVRVWNTETGEALFAPFEGHNNDVRSVAFSPDGERIASGSDDHTVRVWSPPTGDRTIGRC